MTEKKTPSIKIEDYQISDTVYKTQTGKVKLSKNKKTNERVLLEIYKKQQTIDSKQIDHISNELKILNTISHPSIIEFLGFSQDEKYLYFAFEFLNGGYIFSHIQNKNGFSSEICAFYLGQIIFALEYLHSKEIIYRNLKPENLLLKQNGYLKLTGFELAKILENGRTYTMCGTPEYLAPEIIQNKGYGKAVDWWALGVLLYEMLSGIDPFMDDDVMKIYENILKRKLEFSSVFDNDSKSLIKHLCEPDLSKRYGNLKNGVNDIKNHAFFKNLSWEKLLKGELEAPYTPEIKENNVLSNYNVYPDSNTEVPAVKIENDPFADW